MAGAKEIRTKIKSIQSTQKITRAMEMVAASKMRKAQERMREARPYAEKIRHVIAHLAAALPQLDWDISVTCQYLAQDIAAEPLKVVNGHVRVPDRPGLGIEDQNAVLGRLEEAAIANLRSDHRSRPAFRVHCLRDQT